MGASTGAAPLTSMRAEYSAAASRPAQRSRTTARDTATTAHAPKPCANRAAQRTPSVGASAPAAEARV
jgi:hypothetical protein